MPDIEISGGVEEIPAAALVSDVVEAPASEAEKAKQAALEAVEITNAERERLALEAEQRISEHSETVEELDQWREHQNQQLAQLQTTVENQELALTEMRQALSEVATMLETVTAGMLANSTQEPTTETTVVEEVPQVEEVTSQDDAGDLPEVVEATATPATQERKRRQLRVI